MQDYINKNKGTISVGIITTMIFLYVLQPLMEFVGAVFVKLASYVSSAYVDKIYAQISHFEIMDFGFFFYMMFAFIMVTSISILTIKTWKISNHIKNLDNENTKEAQEKNTTDKENTEKNIDSKSFKTKRITALAIVISILFTLSVSTRAYQLSLLTSFKQHFRIIAAYIPEQEEEDILSKWSSMQSKGDYDKLYETINSIAAKNKIILPKNSIYSFDSI